MKNSDRYKTAKERAEAFWKWYTGYNIVYEAVESFAKWLDLEAEAEEPLPCPFCGGKVQVKEKPKDGFHTGLAWLMCGGCGYASSNEFDKASAIAAHNRVARAAAQKASDAVQFDDDGKRALCESCTHWHVGCTYGLRYGTDPCEKYEARAAKEKEAK